MSVIIACSTQFCPADGNWLPSPLMLRRLFVQGVRYLLALSTGDSAFVRPTMHSVNEPTTERSALS